jgi:uncharacterized membrane protein YqgA involved in biofilm formation
MLLGTLVNACAIIVGSLLGLLLKGGIKKNFRTILMQAIGLMVIVIGLKNALRTEAILVIIFSLVSGSILGEWVDIETRLEHLGQLIENRFAATGGNIAKGFVTASLIFCVGSMAIVGSLESGLDGNHQTLFAKSVLDGITSVVFASTFGIGVLFSALSVLLYQGLITFTASVLKLVLVPSVVVQMSAVGGLLIMAIGINILMFKHIKVGNMLPAIFMPLLFFLFKSF